MCVLGIHYGSCALGRLHLFLTSALDAGAWVTFTLLAALCQEIKPPPPILLEQERSWTSEPI